MESSAASPERGFEDHPDRILSLVRMQTASALYLLVCTPTVIVAIVEVGATRRMGECMRQIFTCAAQ
eukprot:5933245-Pleurochrysis_carterae.AAC.1